MATGIALLGCGTVGSAVAWRLSGNARSRRGAGEEEFTLAGIAVKDPDKKRELPPGIPLTGDWQELVDSEQARVIVEAMTGEFPAAHAISRALRSGKDVVTANKVAVARHLEEFREAAEEGGSKLLCEATVGGGMPVISLITHGLCEETVISFDAILNGTTNFILHRLDAGESFDSALAEAASLGYTELDPSDDLDGTDAAMKCSILAACAAGVRILPGEIPTLGMRGIGTADCAEAKKEGFVVKLVASWSEKGHCSVGPRWVARSHPLALVEGRMNGVVVNTASGDSYFLSGPGAGGGPTSRAIMNDLAERNRTRPWLPLKKGTVSSAPDLSPLAQGEIPR